MSDERDRPRRTKTVTRMTSLGSDAAAYDARPSVRSTLSFDSLSIAPFEIEPTLAGERLKSQTSTGSGFPALISERGELSDSKLDPSAEVDNLPEEEDDDGRKGEHLPSLLVIYYFALIKAAAILIVVPTSDAYLTALNAPGSLSGLLVGLFPAAGVISAYPTYWALTRCKFRTVFIICALGGAAGNILYGLAYVSGSPSLLLVSRIVAGLFQFGQGAYDYVGRAVSMKRRTAVMLYISVAILSGTTLISNFDQFFVKFKVTFMSQVQKFDCLKSLRIFAKNRLCMWSVFSVFSRIGVQKCRPRPGFRKGFQFLHSTRLVSMCFEFGPGSDDHLAVKGTSSARASWHRRRFSCQSSWYCGWRS